MQISDKWKKDVKPGVGKSLVNKVKSLMIEVDQQIHATRLEDPPRLVTKWERKITFF